MLTASIEVNARSLMDLDGWGGQTPILRAVNSVFDYCQPIVEKLG